MILGKMSLADKHFLELKDNIQFCLGTKVHLSIAGKVLPR